MKILLKKLIAFFDFIRANKADSPISGTMLLHRYKDGKRVQTRVHFMTNDPDFAENWPCSDTYFPVVYIKHIEIL